MDWQQTELIFKQLEVYACSSHPRSLCPASLSDAFGATELHGCWFSNDSDIYWGVGWSWHSGKRPRLANRRCPLLKDALYRPSNILAVWKQAYAHHLKDELYKVQFS